VYENHGGEGQSVETCTNVVGWMVLKFEIEKYALKTKKNNVIRAKKRR
jgi:hypothetical protein